jgi:16S rRNA processing protein RimM
MRATGAPDPRRRVVIARVGGFYGVRGWVRLKSFSRPRENVFNYVPWLLDDGTGEQAWMPADTGVAGRGLVVRLEGIDNREQASRLLNRDVRILRSQLPELPAGEYYQSDLIGLRVVNADGAELGTVADIIETGAQDVLVVTGSSRELIPFVTDRIVRSVDLEQQRISVDWDTAVK